LGRFNRTPGRLAVEKGYRAFWQGSPGAAPCMDFGIDLGPGSVNVIRSRVGATWLRREDNHYRA